MAYNPKRPRPVLDDDEAPVEALIADEDVVEDPVAVEGERQVIDLADRIGSDEQPAERPEVRAAESASTGPASTSPASTGPATTGPATDARPAADARPSAAAASSTVAPPSSSREGSNVPVAPAPTEETANRAVAVATGAVAIITLIVLLLLRRRSRQQ